MKFCGIKIDMEADKKEENRADAYGDAGRSILAERRRNENIKLGAGVATVILLGNLMSGMMLGGILLEFNWVFSAAALLVIYLIIKKDYDRAKYIFIAVLVVNLVMGLIQ